jgi:hypothetical protein
MALTGTLKDFGIAEILQLIGQQAKSGVLHLRSRDDVIHIAIADGNVVRAEASGRKTPERLGNMLVRAELITEDELEQALSTQKRTLRRLGDILVDRGVLTRPDLRGMAALQTTETVYRLFHWKSGTYEFEPGDVEWDADTVTPLRAESVLMEGFRRVDEWPLVRKRITSSAMTFRKLAPLEPERERDGGGDDDGEHAFEALGEEPGRDRRGGDFASLGRNERRVYELADPGRTVEKIVDLSRLGEFETCKALVALLNRGLLAPVPPASRAGAAVGAYARDWQAPLRRGAARVVATVAIAAALAGIAYWTDRHGLALGPAGMGALRDNAGQRFLARYQLERLRGALEVYRLEQGEYPDLLEKLVEAGLASGRDLRYPWKQDYHYRRKPDGRFVLLPPVE